MKAFVCQKLHFSDEKPSWGEWEGAFIRRGRLRTADIHKRFLILGGNFIGGRCLKEGGCLLEDLPYFYVERFKCK